MADARTTHIRSPFGRRPLKIFISYRREDSVDSAGRLYSALKAYFNRPLRNLLKRKVIVVRDFNTMPAGINFKKHIEEEVKTSAAFITIIGKEWLNFPDAKTGRRRLDDPKDTHRVEIETALSLSIPVFPVLVEGASMPDEEELPGPLRDLALQNAKSVSDPGWDAKVEELINDLELILPSQYLSLAMLGGIASLIILLGALTVYVNCCPANTNKAVTNSTTNTTTPTPTTNPTPPATPVTNLSGPPPAASVTPVATPGPGPTAVMPAAAPSLGGTMWEYEHIGNSGRPILGYVISFAPDGTYIFRCVNKDSYRNKCRTEAWIDSKYATHERRWELDGNKITIFWNRGTAEEVKDVGEVEPGGRRMSGTGRDTADKYSSYSWSATRRD